MKELKLTVEKQIQDAVVRGVGKPACAHRRSPALPQKKTALDREELKYTREVVRSVC